MTATRTTFYLICSQKRFMVNDIFSALCSEHQDVHISSVSFQIPRIFDFFGKNGGTSLFKVPFPTDPRLASYFLPGYPAAIAAAMAAVNAASAASTSPSGLTHSSFSRSNSETPGFTTSHSPWLGNTAPTVSHPSLWPTTTGTLTGVSGGTAAGGCSSASSGYASSEGSNGTSGWFHSAVSPSGFNFSQYYPYNTAQGTGSHPPPSRFPTHLPGRPGDTNPETTTFTCPQAHSNYTSSLGLSTYGGSVKNSMNL
ncbi:hypothetical protein CSKR_101899, partial [Clonorchis sinensis]